MDPSRPEMLRMLRRRIEEIETGQASRPRARVSSGVAALDALFPGGGLRRGMLVELLSATDGAGAWTLGLALARQACGDKRVLVVIDEPSWFYPLAASRLGLDLHRCLVVRPLRWQDSYASMCQSLLCEAVGGVIGWCARVGPVDSQRLRLAAERGGGLGILVRRPEVLRSATCTSASARLLVSPIASGEPARRLRVEVLRGRGRGQVLTLELDDETGDVHSPAVVAPPAPAPRAAPSSG